MNCQDCIYYEEYCTAAVCDPKPISIEGLTEIDFERPANY